MQRRRRAPKPPREPFYYEDYNLVKDDTPHFIRIILDREYMTIAEKEDFLNRFVYEYLEDDEYKKYLIDRGEVLVFEGTKYIDHVLRNDMFKIGNSNKIKNVINIGELIRSSNFVILR